MRLWDKQEERTHPRVPLSSETMLYLALQSPHLHTRRFPNTSFPSSARLGVQVNR